MDIRRMESEEWPVLRSFRLRALADAPDAFGQTIEEAKAYDELTWRGWIEGWETSRAHVAFVAVEEDRWLGMAVGDVGPNHPERAHLYAMWVDPAARRRGVGRELIEAVVEWARETGAVRLHLKVSETNPGAAAMYARSGFVATGVREPVRDGSPLSCLGMERLL